MILSLATSPGEPHVLPKPAMTLAAHEPAWFSHLRAHERTRDARPFVDLEPFLDAREQAEAPRGPRA